jgi:DNA-binding transcriptional ArsR family regulator
MQESYLKPISKPAFEDHLEKLRNAGQIYSDPLIKGKKRYHYLTETTRQELRYHIPEKIKTSRDEIDSKRIRITNKKIDEEKLLKAYQLLFLYLGMNN